MIVVSARQVWRILAIAAYDGAMMHGIGL